ncbi:MAG: glycosyltransferase, partial [Flavobacteriales bacterium]
MNYKKRILISPLDWGLGHATRCIPLIQHLKELGTEVIVAANDVHKTILKEIFSDNEFLDIPSYNIQYPDKGH